MENLTANEKLKAQMFFCYSKPMRDYLTFTKGIDSVFRARHFKSDDAFWIFAKSPELTLAIKEFSNK